MPKATSVIGTLWGDEGKGKTVDYLASGYDVVIRTNGTANCGHTVRGKHIFHSISSGSLKGLPTYFGRNFFLNPIAVLKEYNRYKVDIYCHRAVEMVSPLDVYVNSLRRQGETTGMGMFEAFDRDLKLPAFKDPTNAFEDHYEYYKALIPYDFAKEAWERFVHDWKALPLMFVDEGYLVDKNLLYEGNQGLCLDQNSNDYPWVTPANTGLTDHVPPNHDHDVYYVSRCYATRHGKGPFVAEEDYNLFDTTNVTNRYQGALRYGPLPIELIQKNILKDNVNKLPITFVLNHCDQSSNVGVNLIHLMGELDYSEYLIGYSPESIFKAIHIE